MKYTYEYSRNDIGSGRVILLTRTAGADTTFDGDEAFVEFGTIESEFDSLPIGLPTAPTLKAKCNILALPLDVQNAITAPAETDVCGGLIDGAKLPNLWIVWQKLTAPSTYITIFCGALTPSLGLKETFRGGISEADLDFSSWQKIALEALTLDIWQSYLINVHVASGIAGGVGVRRMLNIVYVDGAQYIAQEVDGILQNVAYGIPLQQIGNLTNNAVTDFLTQAGVSSYIATPNFGNPFQWVQFYKSPQNNVTPFNETRGTALDKNGTDNYIIGFTFNTPVADFGNSHLPSWTYNVPSGDFNYSELKSEVANLYEYYRDLLESVGFTCRFTTTGWTFEQTQLFIPSIDVKEAEDEITIERSYFYEFTAGKLDNISSANRKNIAARGNIRNASKYSIARNALHNIGWGGKSVDANPFRVPFPSNIIYFERVVSGQNLYHRVYSGVGLVSGVGGIPPVASFFNNPDTQETNLLAYPADGTRAGYVVYSQEVATLPTEVLKFLLQRFGNNAIYTLSFKIPSEFISDDIVCGLKVSIDTTLLGSRYGSIGSTAVVTKLSKGVTDSEISVLFY